MLFLLCFFFLFLPFPISASLAQSIEYASHRLCRYAKWATQKRKKNLSVLEGVRSEEAERKCRRRSFYLLNWAQPNRSKCPLVKIYFRQFGRCNGFDVVDVVVVAQITNRMTKTLANSEWPSKTRVASSMHPFYGHPELIGQSLRWHQPLSLL